MRRIYILAAAVAASFLFFSCHKPYEIDEAAKDGVYDETIELILHLSTGKDTSYFYTQTFDKEGNTMIYNPCLKSNITNGWIRFVEYCHAGQPVSLSIHNDTIIYNVKYWDKSIDRYKKPRAKVSFTNDFFTFSYDVDNTSKCIHTCRRIGDLSN